MAYKYDWVQLDKLQWDARRELAEMDAWPFNPRRLHNYVSAVLELLGDSERLVGADIVEIGSSSHQPYGNGLVAWANGANSIRAMDFGEIKDESRVAFGMYELLANFLARPGYWNMGPLAPEKFLSRVWALPLERLEKGDMSLITGRHNIFQYFPYDDSKTKLAPCSADLLMSCSVYEHIRDLRNELAWHLALMKPGGYAAHTIDFRDHRTYVFEEHTPWSFLIDGGYGEGSEAAGVRPDHWVNGLRLSQLLAEVKATGWEVVDVRHDVVEQPSDELRQQFRPEFAKLSEEDLSTLAIRLLLRAPS